MTADLGKSNYPKKGRLILISLNGSMIRRGGLKVNELNLIVSQNLGLPFQTNVRPQKSSKDTKRMLEEGNLRIKDLCVFAPLRLCVN
jgi:hypothetical protein